MDYVILHNSKLAEGVLRLYGPFADAAALAAFTKEMRELGWNAKVAELRDPSDFLAGLRARTEVTR